MAKEARVYCVGCGNEVTSTAKVEGDQMIFGCECGTEMSFSKDRAEDGKDLSDAIIIWGKGN